MPPLEVPGILDGADLSATVDSIAAVQLTDGMIPWFPGGHIRIYTASVLSARLREAGLDVTGSHHAHALHSPYWWIKCAVGVDNDEAFPARLYHRFLVWDISTGARPVRLLEQALNPVIGKSLVMYATKPAAALARPKEPARAAA